ncbi:MAG: GWxTD domain-containing protein [Ignavibacterium album]|uniref:GWxTD domain-containing protein n=1 Tax=Ignavibacterium album TaxID=591197 RepID=UPI0026F0ADD3|nr:GWxTD domain-containing protein [Ignavibacterium album]MCX8105134.1 GWxTD domain-containing protein [Ignavibacterium album]
MKKIFTAILGLFLYINISFAQDAGFDFDYAQFAYDSTSNYVEIYYVFDQGKLTLVNKEGEDLVEASLTIQITDSTTSDTLVNNQWFIRHPVESKESISQSLVGVVSFILPKGTKQCIVKGTDLNNALNFRTITEFIRIRPFINANASISDIQLASKMVQGSENKNSVFYKNTYEVIPIPNLVFGGNQPALFFYSEIYNIGDPNFTEDTLKLNEIIFNSRGKVVLEKNKFISRKNSTRVEVGSFILSKLPTDTYTLAISLIDTSKNIGVTSSKRFFVYNPEVVDTDTSFHEAKPVLSSTFGTMSEEELDDIFDKSKYIATSQEIDKYKKLTGVEGKREFLFNFWNGRDKDPSTKENEYFYDYLQRVESANTRFGSMQKAGWKTDRGRVFIIYGEPSEIERYPNQIESRPYEIWYYNELEGGVYFVFADLTGFSEYTLVHSTKRGELRDDNWGRRTIIAR